MRLRQALAHETIVGTFVSIYSPAVVEILGRSGFDLVCIDSEHAPFGPTEVQEMIRAADSVGTAALVRVPGIGPEIGRALDSGAAGVLVPMVESAAQAAAAVAAVRYPPTGVRGAGPGRAAAYGIDLFGYLSRAEEEVATIVQIESALAVENVEEIVAVPGLDMVFVGPGDLSVSLGVPMGSPEHSAAIRRVVEAARAAGMPVGMFNGSAASIAEWSARGVTFFLLSGDLAMLASTAGALATDGRAAVSAEAAA